MTAVEPGVRFTWRTTEGADACGSREVEALGPDRCRVRLVMVVRPSGPERLVRPVLARMLRANLRHDLERLRSLVATPAPAATASLRARQRGGRPFGAAGGPPGSQEQVELS